MCISLPSDFFENSIKEEWVLIYWVKICCIFCHLIFKIRRLNPHCQHCSFPGRTGVLKQETIRHMLFLLTSSLISFLTYCRLKCPSFYLLISYTFHNYLLTSVLDLPQGLTKPQGDPKATSRTPCQSQTRINLVGCIRKGIQHETGGCRGCVDGCFLGWLSNPTEMVSSTQFLFPLHQQNLETWHDKTE